MPVIRVLLFAALREAVGRDRVDLPAAGLASAGDVWTQLSRDFPELARFTARARVAVNGVYASMETPIGNQDEVVFFPPVSGGC